MRFFNTKKLNLRLAHKFRKAKFEKRATSSTAEFHHISETFNQKLVPIILKKKTHPQLRYPEATFKEKLYRK